MPKKMLLLLFSAILLIPSLQAVTPARGLYLHLLTGYDFALRAVWRDTDPGDKTAVPVYGEGYSATGKAGNSVVFNLGLGYRLSPRLALEAGIGFIPAIKFSGRVNYPLAGDHQPVSTRLRAGIISLGLRFHPLRQGDRLSASWLNPFIALAGGVSWNHTDPVEMSFPDLARPHTFLTPEGQAASFYYGISAGNSLRLGHRLDLDIGIHYQCPGSAATNPGEAQILRADRSIPIGVNKTETWIQTVGLGIGLRYHL
jgi:hypothetical protein